MMRTTIMLAALAAFIPACSHAACSDDATKLGDKYGITASLPQAGTQTSAPASGEATTEKLAKSGGVIAPPATGDMAGVQTVVPNPEPMQTAPSLAPQTAEGGLIDKGKTAKVESSAAASSQAASLLQAAREAGLKGDDATCKQRLADAKVLLEKAPVTSQ